MNEPVLLNAFPKAGTHYLAQLLQPLAAPNRATLRGIAGHTYQGWGRDRRPAETVLLDLSQVQAGERTIATCRLIRATPSSCMSGAGG